MKILFKSTGTQPAAKRTSTGMVEDIPIILFEISIGFDSVDPTVLYGSFPNFLFSYKAQEPAGVKQEREIEFPAKGK